MDTSDRPLWFGSGLPGSNLGLDGVEEADELLPVVLDATSDDARSSMFSAANRVVCHPAGNRGECR
jgi:hypothetical protein